MGGFRFRHSMRLAKGLRINLSKSLTSLSVGRRGATVNFGPKGERVTVGLPGTGLSYSDTLHTAQPHDTSIPAAPDKQSTVFQAIGRIFIGLLILFLMSSFIIGLLRR
jgi:hypothetical protein